MPRPRDASPVRFNYETIGPKKFTWNELKEEIESLGLGSKVEANLLEHNLCTREDPLLWDNLYPKKRCLPYLRVAVCVVLYENIEPTHPFYDKLSRAFT